MKIDYYSATINDTPQNIMQLSKDVLEAQWIPAKSGQLGYKARAILTASNGNKLATLLWAGNDDMLPHMYSSSDNSIIVSEMLRNYYYDRHTVSRIDVCEDYIADYNKVYKQLARLAKKLGIKVSTAGDWLTPNSPDGRTLYLGAPSSEARVRLYEKGKQQKILNQSYRYDYASKLLGIEQEKDPLDNWVRLELQYKPKDKVTRQELASTEPLKVWGATSWTQLLADKILKQKLDRLEQAPRLPPDDERTLNAMITQYRRYLTNKANELGGFEALGLYLQDEIERINLLRNLKQ